MALSSKIVLIGTNAKRIRHIILYILILFVLSFKLNVAESPDTLAIVGNEVISVEKFVKLFNDKKTRLGLADNLEFRTNYLSNIISDELIITHARLKGLDKTNESLKELKRIELQELLNTYTLKHISPQIDISEEELKDLFVKINTRLDVSHLYAPNREKADELFRGLQKGNSFEELARQNFDDPVLKNNGGSLGYITVDEMDPDFEKVAYSLKVGEVSKPIKTVRGYSIIKLNGIVNNPLITESEYLKVHDRLKSLARKRKFEEVVKEYSNTIYNDLDIKVDDSFLSKLFYSIQNTPNNHSIEQSLLVNNDEVKRTIVTSKLGIWDLNTLINEMSLTTPKLKKWLRTEENLKDFISGLVIRKFISNNAYNEKLDTSITFMKNVKYNYDTYLMTQSEEQLKNKIQISPDIIEEYYSQNKNYFLSEPQIRLSSILVETLTLVDTIKYMLDKGEDFESLAHKYSIQNQTAIKGGDMGFFKIKDLDYLGDTLFTLNIGEWGGPFLSDEKYVFVKCTERKKAEYMSLEESSDQIKESLTSMKWFNLREEYVNSLKQEIEVRLFPEKLKELKL